MVFIATEHSTAVDTACDRTAFYVAMERIGEILYSEAV